MLTVLCQPHCHHLQPTSNCRQSATKYTSRPGPGGRLMLNNFRDDEAPWLLSLSDQIYIQWWGRPEVGE